ncbi:hypothetical protein NITHO_1260006 [Nitrolancea hollandica Lb]|uniref:Uncharacterized protein n=1 Tax=Nitrolancea hollandica Lb TaxID=1129897 RepID=I4ECW1_9BACT|nr:hypothetical protein NITHO_1260006 [Nitrolancea hollandica Lb]
MACITSASHGKVVHCGRLIRGIELDILFVTMHDTRTRVGFGEVFSGNMIVAKQKP